MLKPILLCLVLAVSIFAQEEKPKPRIFITDSHSWEIAGGFSATEDTVAGSVRGGARPQTAEIIKTFGEKCQGVTVTMNAGKADYVVMLDHEGGKGAVWKDNKYAVFKRDGDAIKSGSTRSLGNAVKDACTALTKDWQEGKRTACVPTPTNDAERLRWILTVAKGAKRCAEIGCDNSIMLHFLRGIVNMTVASKGDKVERDRIEALARKYEAY